MTAATETASTTKAPDDIVRRGQPRELPCKLTEEDFVRISRTRVNKEAERDQLEDDLDHETKVRKAQIKELQDEINLMGRQLRTGEQERTVKTNEVFRKHDDGTGWIYVIRLDTFDEVERRPATAHETQRYLPTLDGPAGSGLLGKAAAAQRSAQPDTATPAADDGVPKDDDTGDAKSKRKAKEK